MAMEKNVRVIDDKEVVVTQLPATYANQLFTKVFKYFGSVLPQLMAVFQDILKRDPELAKKLKEGKIKIIDLPVDWRDFTSMINDFASKLDPVEWNGFCIKMPAFTDIAGKRILDEEAFNTAFTGKLLFMVKVLVFTMEVNYGDFFEVSGIGKAPTPPAKTNGK